MSNPNPSVLRVAVIYLGRQGMGGPLSAETALGLRRLGHEVFAAVSSWSEALPLWEAADFPVLALPTYRGWGEMLWTTTLARRSLRRLQAALRRFAPDVLLFPMFHPWNALLQRAFVDIPSVTVVHDPSPHPIWYDHLAARVERLSIRQADRCVVLSQAMRQVLADSGILAERIAVSRLERLLAHPQAQPSGPQHDPPDVLFFGRITRYKGVDVLLEAMETVWQQLPQARLRLVGSGDLRPYQRWLERHAGDARLQVRQGWLPDEAIPAIFGQASVVALPYTEATQSGVAVLAASFGLPVVATASGALPEQVQAGVSGWVVPPGDAQALAAALLESLARPDETARRGQALWASLASPEARLEALRQLEAALRETVETR